ncbi:MAG: hypothetical protein FWE38_04460 [Firmicutes bacterium]|nr:hypothetical protein [Bacillota bacterium]
MKQAELTAKWRTYITAIRQAEEYAESRETGHADMDLEFPTEPCLETNKRQIIKMLNEVITDKSIRFPLARTYQAKGRPEFQKLIYTIELTDRIFFVGNERYFANIIYDHYNIEHGIHGIYEIVSQFVNWVDLDIN